MPRRFRHHLELVQIAVMAIVALSAFTGAKAYSNDVLTPRIAALGGAGRAAPLLADAVFQNPSYFSLMQTYCISANLNRYSGTDPAFQGRQYSLSLMDGRNELFQAGVAYSIREDSRMFHIGLSKAPGQAVAIGAATKILLPNDASVGTLVDTTVAVTYKPEGWFQGSLIGENLIETAAIKAQGFNRTITMATKINLEGILTIYADPQWRPGVTDGSAFGLEIGGELGIMADLFLRFGYFKNGQVPYLNTRGTGLGLGIGWSAPRIAFDYGFHRTLEVVNGGPSSFAHIFGTSVYF